MRQVRVRRDRQPARARGGQERGEMFSPDSRRTVIWTPTCRIMSLGRAIRIRPQAIRGRMALLATVLAVLILTPAGVLATMLARQEVTKAIWLEARQQAVITAAAVRDGQSTDPIVPRVAGIDLVQVVAP